jgi:hypothetical protein
LGPSGVRPRVSYSGGESRWYTGKTDLVKTDLTNPKYLPFLLLPSLSLVRPLLSFSPQIG